MEHEGAGMSEIDPCPFCGKQPETIMRGPHVKLVCSGHSPCGTHSHTAETETFGSLDEAIDAWNQRPLPQSLGEVRG